MNNIKYIVLQPLTGGMYLAAEQSIGHPAECIISYSGLDDVKRDKRGNVAFAGNEYNLTEYLKKHNRMPPYYTFKDMKMFDNINYLYNISLADRYTNENVNPDYNNIDLVLAVPVCSGLSNSTIVDNYTRGTRNQNMLFLTRYTLSVIKPSVYIFENAQTLMGNPGNEIRIILQNIAEENGYKIAYYKTDTQLHDNCQRRPRTFVYFFKSDKVPKIAFDNRTISIDEFLSRIPKESTQQFTLNKYTLWHEIIIKYLNIVYGENWRNIKSGKIFASITEDEEQSERFLSWLNASDYNEKIKLSITKYMKHALEQHKNKKCYWVCTPTLYKDFTPACMHKNIENTLHYKEDRIYTCREWLSIMGMPYDFELQGNYRYNYGIIGQNVPVYTAKFIIDQAVKWLNQQYDNSDLIDCNSYVIFDNINKTININ